MSVAAGAPVRDLGLPDPNGPKVWFFHVTGCPACAKTKPEVEAFTRRHPRFGIEWVNLAEVEWPSKTWRPPGWPCFVLLMPDGGLFYLLGSHTSAQLATWLSRHVDLSRYA